MLISASPDDLCLAFANTLSWRGSAPPVEALCGFADLRAWLEQAGALVPQTSADIGAARDTKAFTEAIALREVIYRIFSAAADGEPAGDGDFAALAEAVAMAPARRHLARSSAGAYGWQIGADRSATTVLAPVLWSAADLIIAGGRRRIRQCANEKCLWLFLDESKNGTRRWCDMASCGNRAKARRHYSKIKHP